MSGLIEIKEQIKRIYIRKIQFMEYGLLILYLDHI